MAIVYTTELSYNGAKHVGVRKLVYAGYYYSSAQKALWDNLVTDHQGKVVLMGILKTWNNGKFTCEQYSILQINTLKEEYGERR